MNESPKAIFVADERPMGSRPRLHYVKLSSRKADCNDLCPKKAAAELPDGVNRS
jgi:hypothetical protein